MALNIDWGNRIINVPKADLTLIQSVPYELRELNLYTFHLELRDMEDDHIGMAYPKTHTHNTTVAVGGANLARVIQLVNGYTVTFEDGMYAVNLVGANSNVADFTNLNMVSVRSANSAGLQDLSLMQEDIALARKLLSNRVNVSVDDTTTTIYDDDGTTVLWTFTHSDSRNRVPV